MTSTATNEPLAIAPRLRIHGDKWVNLLWLIPLGFAVWAVAVAVGKGLYTVPAVTSFIERYPGIDGRGVPPGRPAWVGWSHFFNLFLMMFIIRSGLQIYAEHPRLYLSRDCTPDRDEWLRVAPPVPAEAAGEAAERPRTRTAWTAQDDAVALPAQLGLPGSAGSIGPARWWHLGVDVLWLINGAVFYVLLFATGQWRHLVPMSWDVFPNAASVLLQYLALDFPADNGWYAYNGLQLLFYYTVVFIAAPLAVITGLGMSPVLSTRMSLISKRFTIQTARSLHFLVMVFFVLFIFAHVTLVTTTDVLRRLNHMFAARDDAGWVGFWVFAAAMTVTVIAWVAASPATAAHPRLIERVGTALIGPLQWVLGRMEPDVTAFTEADISSRLWQSGRAPENAEYAAMADAGFAGWRLSIGGLVRHPVELTLDELRALPYRDQITLHFCTRGWSGVAKWGGVLMSVITERVQPLPEARWVVFSSAMSTTGDQSAYYDVHPIEHMAHHLTLLAYTMNDTPLPRGHGAPLRLRNERQAGCRGVKWLTGIQFVADYSGIGEGHGGTKQDREYLGRNQTI